jgi:poly-gamma-glutamate synthesis protein (capsule biosynthesis protein)
MTGRGIDQALPYPVDPRIHEPFMKSATGYVELAEAESGPIPRPVDFSYIWGDAKGEFERARPDLRIVNLETAVTKSEEWLPKGINYRMSPENITCLTAAGVDCCSLANNHVLDWGETGLAETLETLKKAGIKSAGAGRNIEEAEAPAVMELPGKGRVLVFAMGSVTSGVPPGWAAAGDRPGVNFLEDFSRETALGTGEKIRLEKNPGDIAVFSVHWGGNWGYEIPQEQRDFARMLVDEAGVDVVHGHSSHHAKGIEVYNGKLILYGCGDFINDYEGIAGYEQFRADLGLMYFPSVDPRTGGLLSLRMTPTRMRRFRVNRASAEEAAWVAGVLNREGRSLGTEVGVEKDGSLQLHWQG